VDNPHSTIVRHVEEGVARYDKMPQGLEGRYADIVDFDLTSYCVFDLRQRLLNLCIYLRPQLTELVLFLLIEDKTKKRGVRGEERQEEGRTEVVNPPSAH
jgi:hypothetical protein